MRSLPPLPTNRTWPRDPIALVCRYRKPKKRRSPRRDRAEEKRLRADLVAALNPIFAGALEDNSSALLVSSSWRSSIDAKRPAPLRTSMDQQKPKRSEARKHQ